MDCAQDLQPPLRIGHRCPDQRRFEWAADAIGVARRTIPRCGHHRLVIGDLAVLDVHPMPQPASRCFRRAVAVRLGRPTGWVPAGAVVDGQPEKILTFSELSNSIYSLYPTESAPTMLISGIPMHRIKDTDPVRDTRAKIKAARPAGRVLDTATGLGYTAIQAAQIADQVITVELDPAAQQICRQNPWSQDLFANPRIEQRMDDSFDVIETLPDASFQRIIHDPPTFSLAGHLYSHDFYVEMHRVLRPGGRAFHYIGDPESKSGSRITVGVIRRLEQAGFTRVQRAPRAFGVMAYK